VTARLARFEAACRAAGVKLTHQRLVIFQAVASSGEHPDVETLYRQVRQQLPTVSLDTVYRTLWLLHELGLVATLGAPRGRMQFDANMGPHHHFVCSRCGLTRDLYCESYDHLTPPAEASQWGQAETIRVEVRGVCRTCRAADPPAS
jgi:Fur family peroxide stress response transcriptional regulator